MNLILGGGGAMPQTKKVNDLFLSLLKNKQILYIPVAIDTIKHPYDSCLAWLKQELNSTKNNLSIEMWVEKDIYEKGYSDLLKFGGIYIGGGNTFYLLDEFRKSEFDKKLVKLLSETDIPVFGGSAGALIFTKGIDTAIPYDPNDVGLKDLSGLGVFNHYIWVHYEDSMKGLVNEYSKKLGEKIYTVREDEWIWVEGDKTNKN